MKKLTYTTPGVAKTGFLAALTLLLLGSPLARTTVMAYEFSTPPTALFGHPTADTNIRGRITDETGSPLAGATVALKGTTIGAITDADGYFSLRVPEGTDATLLVVSYTGYLSKQEIINGRAEINVSLAPDANQLGELVVIGYGTQNKKDLTGSVGTVNVQSINKVATNDVTKAIQGQVAGVSVHSGGEGSGSTFTVLLQ